MLEYNAGDAPDLARMAGIFERFANESMVGASPIYQTLSQKISKDPDLLQLAVHASPGQPAPNLFLAAVQDLLLLNAPGSDALKSHYPTLANGATPRGDVFAAFKQFSLAHGNEVIQRLTTRTVQTNEVRRCAVTWPVIAAVFEQHNRQPLTLIEVGTSAGLNLHGDHYRYEYVPEGAWGDPQSEVVLACELRGPLKPPLPENPPTVKNRIGLDLHPIDVHSDHSVRWLRALIWPEHTDRLAMLDKAIAVVQQSPATMVQGDALETLPQALDTVPVDDPVFVFHSFTINQWTEQARERLWEVIDKAASERPLHYLTLEALNVEWPELTLTQWENGKRRSQLLARCEGHCRWIEWLGSST